jgi:NADH-quinone oxidoreductase subunit C
MSVIGISSPEAIEELLVKRFGAAVNVDGPPQIDAARHLELATVLRDQFGYRIFGFVVASHHPIKGEDGTVSDRLRVVYGLRSVGANSNIAAWQVEVAAEDSIPSLARLFAGADWQEREQYDLLGIRFSGHPDLRRLMLPEDWKGHPLRKDYAIDTEVPPWR